MALLMESKTCKKVRKTSWSGEKEEWEGKGEDIY